MPQNYKPQNYLPKPQKFKPTKLINSTVASYNQLLLSQYLPSTDPLMTTMALIFGLSAPPCMGSNVLGIMIVTIVAR